MSKTVKTESKRWAGTVVIADPLTIPQAQLIEAAMRPVEGDDAGKVYLSQIDANQLPAVIACVEKWDVTNMPEGVTVETFPASPRKESHEFISWLFGEVLKVYFGELNIPNA